MRMSGTNMVLFQMGLKNKRGWGGVWKTRVETYSYPSASIPYVSLTLVWKLSLEVNHSRFQAPTHFHWNSMLHKVAGVNMGIFKGCVTQRWDVDFSAVATCAFKWLLFKSLLYKHWWRLVFSLRHSFATAFFNPHRSFRRSGVGYVRRYDRNT